MPYCVASFMFDMGDFSRSHSEVFLTSCVAHSYMFLYDQHIILGAVFL